MPMTRYRKWLVGAGVAVVAIPLLFWVLVTLILPGVIRDQARSFGEKIGYQIEVGEIDLTPLLLRVRVNDIRLAPTAGDALLKLKQLEVDARFLPLLIGRVSFDRIALDAPEVLFARAAGKDTHWNWLAFVDRVKTLGASEPPKDPEKHSSLRVAIDEFAINGGRVAVRDGQKQAAYDLGPFSIHLTELSNQDEAGHVGGSSLQSKYTLNLGSVKVPLPKEDGVPDRQLVFSKVTATGALVEHADATLRTHVDLMLDEGEIKSSWQMTGEGALSGKISTSTHWKREPTSALDSSSVKSCSPRIRPATSVLEW